MNQQAGVREEVRDEERIDFEVSSCIENQQGYYGCWEQAMKKEAQGRINRLRLSSKTRMRQGLSEERSNMKREARKEGGKEGEKRRRREARKERGKEGEKEEGRSGQARPGQARPGQAGRQAGRHPTSLPLHLPPSPPLSLSTSLPLHLSPSPPPSLLQLSRSFIRPIKLAQYGLLHIYLRNLTVFVSK